MKSESIIHLAKTIYASQEHISICERLLDCFERTDSEQLQMLTYSMISNICRLGEVNNYLIEVLNFLSGHKVNVLKTNFLLIDDSDDEFEIDYSTINSALRDNYLIHPMTGKKIDNFKDYIVIYYCLSDQFEKGSNNVQR
jgi:hypothetical protein